MQRLPLQRASQAQDGSRQGKHGATGDVGGWTAGKIWDRTIGEGGPVGDRRPGPHACAAGPHVLA